LAGAAAAVAVAVLGVAALGAPGVAGAAVRPFDRLDCVPRDGVQFCEGRLDPAAGLDGRVESWDGVPLDVNVALPAGAERDLPLVVLLHGWSGRKGKFEDLRTWAARGYAVLSYTARGFQGSCGRPDNRALDPEGCAQGFIRLDDTRYEVRDTQELAGRLVDEGIADPRRIGAVGGSYGGGHALALAALRDRVMAPDGSLVPWRSPAGRPMRLAGAAPDIPWSDLAYALTPNGRHLDYAVAPARQSRDPVGVVKQSFVAGLYASGGASGHYAPAATPGADITGWFRRMEAGEPYADASALQIASEVTAHHSAYAIPHGRAPAPVLISNGWTDDLFPVDEALRFYNRTRDEHPRTPIALFLSDHGHMRAANKPADEARRLARVVAWIDRWVKGDTGTRVLRGVEALTQTCPKDAASGGPFRAPSWRQLAPGEVRLRGRGAKTIVSTAGDPAVGSAIDPITGGGDACASAPSGDQAGTATYRLPAARARGFTLLGSPTVVADLSPRGEFPHLAARLWDVAPGGGPQTLVARGLYRVTGGGRQVLQLHPNGWRFAPGHVAKLELLGADAPYGRPSNGTFRVRVSGLQLRLPVRERPGRGAAAAPARLVVPGGARLAPGYENRAR